MGRELKPINVEIGSRIRKVREDQKLTREELAERVGISSRFCADIERGAVGASLTTLKKICQELGVTSDSLLWGRTSTVSDQIAAMLANTDEEYMPYILSGIRNQLDLLNKALEK